jgi:hypothetical protein
LTAPAASTWSQSLPNSYPARQLFQEHQYPSSPPSLLHLCCHCSHHNHLAPSIFRKAPKGVFPRVSERRLPDSDVFVVPAQPDSTLTKPAAPPLFNQDLDHVLTISSSYQHASCKSLLTLSYPHCRRLSLPLLNHAKPPLLLDLDASTTNAISSRPEPSDAP